MLFDLFIFIFLCELKTLSIIDPSIFFISIFYNLNFTLKNISNNTLSIGKLPEMRMFSTKLSHIFVTLFSIQIVNTSLSYISSPSVREGSHQSLRHQMKPQTS